MIRSTKGFSLIEILVTLTIISLLSAFMYANFTQGAAQSRDAERKASLRTLQTAIELYKNENGRYPAQCPSSQLWSGQKNSSYSCNDGSGQYIVNLAPKYIPTLPTDPKLNGTNSGFVYITNSEGTSYKVMVARTVETESMSVDSSRFKSCEVTSSDDGICDKVCGSNSRPASCEPFDTVFAKSYALWGGYPSEPVPESSTCFEEQLENVICRMP